MDDAILKAALAEHERRRRIQNIKALDLMTYRELLRIRDAVAVMEALGIAVETGLSGAQISARLRVGLN
ncbi:MAG: hypothetical protein WC551_10405 [Patescibacteria group bacterium]